MSEDEHPGAEAIDPDNEREPGEPITELKRLERETTPLFFSNVRRKIHRRATASQLLTSYWQMLGIVFAELGNMLLEALSRLGSGKDNK